MSKILTKIFLILAMLSATLFSSQGWSNPPRTGSEYTEQMLATRAYAIPPNTNVLAWLENLIRLTEQDSAKHPEHRNENFLIIGDAYHWIGHIAEDRRDFNFAWDAHMKSYEAYMSTPYQASAFITNLNAVTHAKSHLAKVAPRVGGRVPSEGRDPEVTEKNALEDMDHYKKRVAEIIAVPMCHQIFVN